MTQLMLDLTPSRERQPWVPSGLVDHHVRRYDHGQKRWREWEHNPDCSGCDGYGHYGADRHYGEHLTTTSASCPCGGWADEVDRWATVEVARLIRARRAVLVERAPTKPAEVRP